MSVKPARDAGSAGPLVLCYDGSAEAAEAITFAAELLPGRRTVVVCAWKPIIEEALTTAMTPPVADLTETNKRQRQAAEQFAAQGAKLATKAGFEAKPVVVEADGPLWEAVERVAEKHHAVLIVCGTSRSGMKAALPGNLAGALVNHASRPVLVVPSRRAAEQRLRDVKEGSTPLTRARARAKR
jgi:nucleotide-binding universal stress UspA family protein